MKTIGEIMTSEGGNLGWCKPYQTEDGTSFVNCSGCVPSAIIAGVELETPSGRLTEESYRTLAQAIYGDEYPLYSGYSDAELITMAANEGRARECDCADCPWFSDCEAMREEVEDT